MDEFQTALAVGAIITAGLSWHVPRALLWISLGALSFILSAAWQAHGLPYRDAFGAGTNVVICLALYSLAEKRWEMRVWNCFHAMILLDFLHMGGLINSNFWLIVSLEVANWTALLIIGTAGIMEWAGVRNAFGLSHSRRSGYLYRALHEERLDPPFWKVAE